MTWAEWLELSFALIGCATFSAAVAWLVTSLFIKDQR